MLALSWACWSGPPSSNGLLLCPWVTAGPSQDLVSLQWHLLPSGSGLPQAHLRAALLCFPVSKGANLPPHTLFLVFLPSQSLSLQASEVPLGAIVVSLQRRCVSPTVNCNNHQNNSCLYSELQFAEHFINLLSILLRGNAFARIQKAVVDKMAVGNQTVTMMAF